MYFLGERDNSIATSEKQEIAALRADGANNDKLVTPEEIHDEMLARQLSNTQFLDWKKVEGLSDPRAIYSAETKITAISAFVITGSYKKAADMIGLKPAVLRNWGSNATWWKEAMELIQSQFQHELDARISLILQKGMDMLEDRLSRGDEVLLKDGSVRRKKLPAKDISSIISTLFEKQALMRGAATSITEKRDVTTSDSVLQDLKGAFEKLSSDIQRKQDEKIVNSIPASLISEEIEDV